MARGPRRTRRSRRSRRRRSSSVLKKVLIGLLLLLPVGYFVFSRFVFDPFEEPQPVFRGLVPDDVDLYVRRERLGSDIGDFPYPFWVERLVATPAFRELERGAWWEGLDWPDALAARAAEVADALADAPIDPLDDVLGEEVVLIGRLPGAEHPEGYALLARLSPKGKLATELGSSRRLLDALAPGATLTTVEDADRPGISWQRIDPPGADAIYFARDRDLLVVGTEETIVRDVLRTADAGIELSLGATRLVRDHLPVAAAPPGDRFSAELLLDVAGWLRHAETDEDLAERSEHALTNLVRGLVDPTLLRDTVARLEIDGGVTLRARADLDHGKVREHDAGLLGAPNFDVRDRMQQALSLVPADASGVVTMNVDVQRFLETLHEALDPELVTLANRLIRDAGRYTPNWPVTDLTSLYAYLDRVFAGEVTIAFRPLDHEVPPGSQPLPLLQFILPLRNEELWKELHDVVVRGQHALGVGGKIWEQKEGGFGARTWIELTGVAISEISYIHLQGERMVVVATADSLMQEIVAIYSRQQRSLWTDGVAAPAIDPLEIRRANLVAWTEPDRLRAILDPYGEWLAELDTKLDFVALREDATDAYVARHHPSYRGRVGDLPDAIADEVEAAVDAELAEMEQARLAITVPEEAEAWRERFAWMGLFTRGIAALRLGEKTADLELRLATVLERGRP